MLGTLILSIPQISSYLSFPVSCSCHFLNVPNNRLIIQKKKKNLLRFSFLLSRAKVKWIHFLSHLCTQACSLSLRWVPEIFKLDPCIESIRHSIAVSLWIQVWDINEHKLIVCQRPYTVNCPLNMATVGKCLNLYLNPWLNPRVSFWFLLMHTFKYHEGL